MNNYAMRKRVLITGGLEDRFEEYEESGYAYEIVH